MDTLRMWIRLVEIEAFIEENSKDIEFDERTAIPVWIDTLLQEHEYWNSIYAVLSTK